MTKNRIVDFHAHVLPGMDDGCKTKEISLAVLRTMKNAGVDTVVATPHYYRENETAASFLTRREKQYAEIAGETGLPEILLGAETAFWFGIEKEPYLSALCIEQTNTLLLEMPFSRWGDYEYNALATLILERDYRVVLAHPERYESLQKNNAVAERIMELPLFLQINGRSIYSFPTAKKRCASFLDGKARLLGSDCHDLKGRSPNLMKARQVLQKRAGQSVLDAVDECAKNLLPSCEEKP